MMPGWLCRSLRAISAGRSPESHLVPCIAAAETPTSVAPVDIPAARARRAAVSWVSVLT